MQNHKILVTDGQMRSSLAVIRSLGKKGLPIIVGEDTHFTTSFFSKYCKKIAVYPPPKKEKKSFQKYIKGYVQKNNIDYIFPIADACLWPIIEIEDELSAYSRIALPKKDIFINGYDKAKTLKIALENDIPCPKTFFPNSVEDIYKIEEKLSFPLIIKPTISSGSRGMSICSNFLELIDSFLFGITKYNQMIIQEFIPNGGETSVYCLVNSKSEPRAVSVQKRIRSYPISGGPSTFRETVKNRISNKSIQIAFSLLKKMRWEGVAMVEFRIDARDGIPKLMEVNPRFWGSLQLSILGGVDFPYLLYKLLNEGDIEPVLDYKEGVKCRWLLPGDFLWYFSSPNKTKNLREFLDYKIPDDIISLDDPGPTFGFAIATARHLFNKDIWNFTIRR